MLAAAVLSAGVSEIAIQRGNPQLALGLLGARGDAAAAMFPTIDASNQVADGDRIAQTGLGWSSLNTASLRTLGLRAEAEGDSARALRLMRLAGRSGWRDVPTQAWLMDAAASTGDYPVTVQRASALIRLGVARPQLFAGLLNAVSDPKALPPLIDELTEMPGWRGAFFEGFGDVRPEMEGNVERIALALRQTPTPPTRAEMLGYLRLLVKRGATARGAALWQKLFGETATAGNIPLPWQQFDASEPPTPFDWTPVSEDAQIDYEREAGTQMLVVVGAKAGPVMQRWLALAPGTYRLNGGVITGGGRWALMCGERAISFAESAVTVPAGCAVQRLVFESDGGDGAARVSSPSLGRS